ncbi:MAG TPA: hypothetical protein VF844_16725 [Ktedonobacteraceae bacterium]
MYFEAGKKAPSILISPGSGPGHVFTELAYRIHLSAYDVFMMPNNCGYTIRELMPLTMSPWSPYVGRPLEPRSLRTAVDRPRPSHDMSQPGTVNQSMPERAKAQRVSVIFGAAKIRVQRLGASRLSQAFLAIPRYTKIDMASQSVLVD